MRSDIGYCVWVLFHKKWGQIPIDGRLRSQHWWKTRLQGLIDAPAVQCNCDWEPKPAETPPIPFEIEMGYPDLDYETLLKAWKKVQHRS